MSISNILQKLNSRDTNLIPHFSKFSKILVFCLILFCSTLVVKSIFAQSNGIEYFKAKQQAIEKGNNQEAWMNEALSSNMVSGVETLIGKIPDDVLNGKTTSFIPGGALGITNQLTASLFNPPASGVQYIAMIKDNFLGKPVYAQGIGFQGLQPILPLWREFRNVIYVLTSLFLIIIGIMIMLRVKISPQAVISLQSSLPQIITSLILVTFSYAIAGLLIDLSYLFQSFVLAILFNAHGGLSSNLFSSWGINPSFSDLSQAGFGTYLKLTWKATPFLALMGLAGIPTAIIGALMAPAILSTAIPTGGLSLIAAGAVAASGWILVLLILVIMIFVWLAKFFFGCVKCYIAIIIRIILAPLEIGMGAIPNSKMNFSSWIWSIIANLAVFPISIIFLVLANLIIDACGKNLWTPSVLGGLGTFVTLPAALSGGLVPVAVGLVTLMLLSKLPTMVPEFIFQIKPSPWEKAIGESFKSGVAGKFAGRIGAESGADYIRNANTGATAPRWAKAGGYIVKAAEKAGIIKESR